MAVLFARQDSIYKDIPTCDVWDSVRDARFYFGSLPVVAHPPCRAWGRLRHMAKPRADEKDLALFAVESVRRVGGVLEHPLGSTLWPAAGLPVPGGRDAFGGYTIPIFQSWFGHRAEKATYLYIVGVEPRDLPRMPMMLGEASHVCETQIRKGKPGWRPAIAKPEREKTPVDLARWLVEVAGMVS